MPGVLRLAARPRAELRGRCRRAELGEDVRREHRELRSVYHDNLWGKHMEDRY